MTSIEIIINLYTDALENADDELESLAKMCGGCASDYAEGYYKGMIINILEGLKRMNWYQFKPRAGLNRPTQSNQ